MNLLASFAKRCSEGVGSMLENGKKEDGHLEGSKSEDGNLENGKNEDENHAVSTQVCLLY